MLDITLRNSNVHFSFSEIPVTGLAEKGACLLDKFLSLGSQSYGKTIFKVD